LKKLTQFTINMNFAGIGGGGGDGARQGGDNNQQNANVDIMSWYVGSIGWLVGWLVG
jgi:hypothetical protein